MLHPAWRNGIEHHCSVSEKWLVSAMAYALYSPGGSAHAYYLNRRLRQRK